MASAVTIFSEYYLFSGLSIYTCTLIYRKISFLSQNSEVWEQITCNRFGLSFEAGSLEAGSDRTPFRLLPQKPERSADDPLFLLVVGAVTIDVRSAMVGL